MKRDNGFRPFADLRLKSRISGRLENDGATSAESREKPQQGEKLHPLADQMTDQELFLTAMADVTPLSGEKSLALSKRPKTPPAPVDETTEIRHRLDELIAHGRGFVVSATPEYVEGKSPPVPREILSRLHKGEFSIQGNIDLHGLSLEEAQEAFHRFMDVSIRQGKRMVRVIHGRGLSSPGPPVLKTNVIRWLTAGPLRKWVIAFTSARACDGGAGATYVLLRKRPYTKKERRKKGRNGSH
jgi:DNA-nicking Smr family endonuclease